MQLLHESHVLENEIDTLGHMNVRFYMVRVAEANARLFTQFGLDAHAAKGAGRRLTQVDTFCRYHREQFPGAPLEVRGGVLSIKDASVTMFHQVSNPAKDEIAATFIIEYALIDQATRTAVTLEEAVRQAARKAVVDLPEYGAPRGLQLTPPNLSVTLEDLTAKLGDQEVFGLMGGRGQREVTPEDCDEHGFLKPGVDLMFRGRHVEDQEREGGKFGPPTFVSDEGHRFGWAWLETRSVRIETPRVGDVLQTISAELGLQSKTRHSRRWIFNTRTGNIAGLDDTLGIALDLDARKSIPIPVKVREMLERQNVPELA
jgi:acyl-CoA thioester hydrolase